MTDPVTEPAPSAAAASSRPATESEWLRIGGVGLAVRDLGRVEAFYREVLGFGVVERTADTVRLGAGGAGILELFHQPTALPDAPATAGLFHTAFLLPSRADLGRWLAHAGRLRQALDGAADHLVSEALYLSDPEGNGVEVYADRPRARWRWRDGPDGRRVEMATQPLDTEGLLAEADAAWAGAPDGTRVGHVHLRVGDVAEAVRFYGDRLGMDLTAARPGAAFLSTGGYHHHIAVNAWRSAGAGRREAGRAGLAWVTLKAADERGLAGGARGQRDGRRGRGRPARPLGHGAAPPPGPVRRRADILSPHPRRRLSRRHVCPAPACASSRHRGCLDDEMNSCPDPAIPLKWPRLAKRGGPCHGAARRASGGADGRRARRTSAPRRSPSAWPRSAAARSRG